MCIKQLSRKETKELEQTTTPLANLYSLRRFGGVDEDEFFVDDIHADMAISHWYVLQDDVDVNLFRDHRDRLSELLGMKPNYHVNYEYKNAVWGLEINGHQCVLYTSLRGTSLQVKKEGWKPGEMQEFLKVLMYKLIDRAILEEETDRVGFFLSMCSLP